jgi:hypothetical protein
MLAENGQVALDLVSAASGLGNPFDVIIMDMGMGNVPLIVET